MHDPCMPPVPKPKRNRRPIYLREWRLYRHLTQEQLAERMGINATTLGRVENGKSPYNQDFIEVAAESLGCEPVDLIMRNPQAKDSPWSIFDSLQKASPTTREQIKAVVETLLKTGT